MNIPLDKLAEIIKSLPDVSSPLIEVGATYYVPFIEPVSVQPTFSPKSMSNELIFVKGRTINGYQWHLVIK